MPAVVENSDTLRFTSFALSSPHVYTDGHTSAAVKNITTTIESISQEYYKQTQLTDSVLFEFTCGTQNIAKACGILLTPIVGGRSFSTRTMQPSTTQQE